MISGKGISSYLVAKEARNGSKCVSVLFESKTLLYRLDDGQPEHTLHKLVRLDQVAQMDLIVMDVELLGRNKRRKSLVDTVGQFGKNKQSSLENE